MVDDVELGLVLDHRLASDEVRNADKDVALDERIEAYQFLSVSAAQPERRASDYTPSCRASTTSFLSCLTLVNAHSLCAILTLALFCFACCTANCVAKAGS